MGDVGKAFGDVVGAITGTGGADDAYKAQKKAAGQANATLGAGYKDQVSLLSPFRDAGLKALAGLQDPNFGKNIELDPGYQFRMQEGQKALNNAASARGMANSGATMKALAQYNQNFATNEYGNAYNRQVGRLGTLLGVGADANNSQVNARGQYAQGLAGNQIGLGNAKAAQKTAEGQGLSNLIGQGIQGAAMYFCDENLKTDIAPISKASIEEMKKHLKAYTFKYKDEAHGAGEFMGVMAQDLQKSPLGAWCVEADESGNLKVNMSKVLMIWLASQSESEAA